MNLLSKHFATIPLYLFSSTEQNILDRRDVTHLRPKHLTCHLLDDADCLTELVLGVVRAAVGVRGVGGGQGLDVAEAAPDLTAAECGVSLAELERSKVHTKARNP